MNRNVLFSVAALSMNVICIANAVAAEYVRTGTKHSKVIIAASDKTINLVTGDNPVDKLHTINCDSVSGCVIEIAPSIQTNDGIGVWECAYVDGATKNVKPKCGDYNYDTVLDREQRAVVSEGQHTLQVIVHSDNDFGSIPGWEISYSIYQLKPTDNNDRDD